MTPHRLPRVARVMLLLSVPEDASDQVIADLEELWGRQRQIGGRLTSQFWLWREVLSFALRFLGERVREAVAARVGHLELKLVRRTTMRTPLLTATAICSLAIGIALATSVFGVVSGLMFGHLDVPDGQRVVQLRDVDRINGWDHLVDEATFVRRRASFRTLDLAAYSTASALVETSGGGRVVSVATTSANAFQVLRESPVAGRAFSASDEAGGDLAISVISAELARELFGSPREALGATLRVDGRALSVIGVMRAGFRFPMASSVWVPRAMNPSATGNASLRLFARLAPDASIESAAAEFSVVAQNDSVPGVAPEHMARRVLGFTRMAAQSSVQWALWLAVAALVALMLVSAANVANLLLARAATRGFEFALRTALGASPSRIAGQLLLEALFIASTAAVVGALAARGALAWFRRTVTDLPYWMDLTLGWSELLFIVALVVLAAIVIAALPARRVLRAAPASVMKDGPAPVRFGRLSTILIAVELAVAIGFLGGTASVGRGMARFGFGQSGLDGEGTLVAQLYFGQPPALQRPDTPSDPEQRRRVWAEFEERTTQEARELVQRLQASPRVAAVALGSHFPGNEPVERVIAVENDARAAVHRTRVVEASEGYLASLGRRVLRGRDFGAGDLAAGGTGVLVNERFAQRYGLGNALGRRIRFPATGSDAAAQPWLEIVGVVPDLALNPGNAAEGDGVYLSLQPTNIIRLAMRARGNPMGLLPLLHQEAQTLDPKPQIQWSKTLAAQMAEPVMLFRALGIGLAALGGIALILAAAGVYALLALRVAQSRRELAVRLAIGAQSRHVAQSVLARSAWPAGIGVAAGTVGAFGVTRLVASIPFAIERQNTLGVAGVVGVLAVIVLLGCAVPVRRALRVRPSDLLRS